MSERRGIFSTIAEWVGVFLIAFAVFALIRTFVLSPFTVPTGSMEPPYRWAIPSSRKRSR